MVKIVFLTESGRRPQADLLVAGCFSSEGLARELTALEPDFALSAKTAVKRHRFSGKFGETLAGFGMKFREAPEPMLLGLGDKAKFRNLCARKTAGNLVKIARERKARHVRVLLSSFVSPEVSLEALVRAFTETVLLGTYDFKKYKNQGLKEEKPAALTLELLVSSARELPRLKAASNEARSVAEGVIFARDLVNEPANVINPQTLAAAARKMSAEAGISCRVLGGKEMSKLKMGGILGVSQGSLIPPALIIMDYGRKYASRGTVCLVGKGVTFDTGGLSLKPPGGMEKMKYDMAGSAAVIGTLKAAAGLKLKRHIIGLVPAVENNVSNNPQRPGDIIRMFNGKTVEVLNTDAEGRLILGDALSYAARFKPKTIIDIATLTGMCAATFADQAVGLMGTDEKLVSKIKEAGQASGERCWELPLWEEYGQMIKGKQSDLKNIGGSNGGTITAGMFLKEFVPEKTAWAHLDIAGTAWCETPRHDCQFGATGVGVRLFIQLLSGNLL